MPKAILALRSYPLAILMALVLFLCSLLLATSSTGIIGGGAEDSGSGMGGTGKSGVPSDSGFGGTGGPKPFLGDVDSESSESASDFPAPWLQRETETAQIPDEIAPLRELRLELQRNPLRDPTLQPAQLFPDNPDVLRIIEQDNSTLPVHLRQQLDLANSGEVMIQSAPLEIQLQIPEILAPEPVDIAVLQPKSEVSAESVMEHLPVTSTQAVPEHNSEEIIPEIATETPDVTDPRTATKRIQRPELPPFQRIRPAVDRASIVPARPQPMRI